MSCDRTTNEKQNRDEDPCSLNQGWSSFLSTHLKAQTGGEETQLLDQHPQPHEPVFTGSLVGLSSRRASKHFLQRPDRMCLKFPGTHHLPRPS